MEILLKLGVHEVPTVTAPAAWLIAMLLPATIDVTPVLVKVTVLLLLVADRPGPADSVMAGPVKPLIEVMAAVRYVLASVDHPVVEFHLTNPLADICDVVNGLANSRVTVVDIDALLVILVSEAVTSPVSEVFRGELTIDPPLNVNTSKSPGVTRVTV